MTFGSCQQVTRRLSVTPAVLLTIIGFCLFVTTNGFSQDPNLQQAIDITPKQDVSYEKPNASVLKECTVATTKQPSGFVVHHSSGRILRRFVDTNNDNKLDQWSYYDNGLEVYRDLDTNFDGRTDQYRWVGTAGTRWGLDNDQNGTIDSWKFISAEEVALECFESIRNRDSERFNRLLLTAEELASLQLGSEINLDVAERLKNARSGFLAMAKAQKAINSRTKFLDAGNGRPQMMPAGTFGNKRDLLVYDQASGFFEGDQGNQLALGSVVQVGDVWRMIDLPEIVEPDKPLISGGAFFPLPEFGATTVASTSVDTNLSKLYEALTKVDDELKSAKGAAVEKLEKQKADILVQFYLNTEDPKTKQDWLENLADSVAHSFQMGRFDGGLKYLEKFVDGQKDSEEMDYVVWSNIFAEYGWANSQGDKKQRDEAYSRMITRLEKFQKQYESSPKSADALIQLGVHDEVNSADEPEKAIEWYRQCMKRFPNTKFGRRAAGAVTRLGSFGKTIVFAGKKLDGSDFDIKSLRGKIVVLFFWETWCCDDEDVKELANLAEKYKDELVIVGCNIEGQQPGEKSGQETERVKDFVKSHPEMTWIQLHAPGSVENSPLAHQLGIATEPMICLIDKDNKLVESNIGLANLEREIERERRR